MGKCSNGIFRSLPEKLYDFFDSNLASKTSKQIKENGWKIFYNEGTYYTLDTDKEFYEALFYYSNNHFRATKYKRKIEPKLSVEMTPGADIIKTYDSEDNCYERESDYLFGNHYIITKAKIKGFGEVICYTTPDSDIYRYDIIPESEESPQRYKLNGKTGEVTKK